MIYYIAIDPGKANGVCTYNENAKIMSLQTVSLDELTKFLARLQEVKICICEDYKVYPQMAKKHIYSDLITPRAIGRIESWSEQNGIKLIKLLASNKNIGYRLLGEKQPSSSDKLRHVKDAHALFTFWAVRHNIVKPEELL